MSAPVPGTASTETTLTSGSTPVTKSHTTAAGETYMLVKVGLTSGGVVASVTFGAASLSLLLADIQDSGTQIRGEVWGGSVPDSTTDTVTVTYTGGFRSTVAIISYAGVDSVGTPKSTVMTSGTTSGITFEAGEVGADTLLTDAIFTAVGDNTPTPDGSVEYSSFQDAGPQGKQAGSYDDAGASDLSWTGLNHANRNSIQIGVPLIGEAGGGGFQAAWAQPANQSAA